jgi:hypothetical protein
MRIHQQSMSRTGMNKPSILWAKHDTLITCFRFAATSARVLIARDFGITPTAMYGSITSASLLGGSRREREVLTLGDRPC